MKSKACRDTIVLTAGERAALEDLALQHLGRSAGARRACIILLSADGRSVTDICNMLGCTRRTVVSWRRRFQRARVEGLHRARSARRLGSCAPVPIQP